MKLPPGQRMTDKFPVLDLGIHPRVDLSRYRLRVWGAVRNPKEWDWKAFCSLPMREVVRDFHCVTRWSRPQVRWRGVPTRYILEQVEPEGEYVLVHSLDGYTTNLLREDLEREDVLLAIELDGAPLTVEHGAPVRLVVPHLYGWKSAKWVSGLEFLREQKLGYWEKRGYHWRGDPWKEERFAE